MPAGEHATSTFQNNRLENKLLHSCKKRKDCLESSLDRVLFAADLEFPKILVPSLPPNTIKCKH